MTYPNPAGYYNLKLSPEREAEITGRNFESLLEILMELTESIYLEHGFVSSSLDQEFDAYIDSLALADQLSLIRWIGELLAAKNNEA